MDKAKDDGERLLWRAFVDAEHAYLKFVEPQSMRVLEHDIAGLVLDTCNPVCCRTFGLPDPDDIQAKECLNDDKGKGSAEQRKAVRALLREFHPDKNPTCVSEAQDFCQMILHYLDKQELSPIEELYKTLIEQGSDAAWEHVKRMRCRTEINVHDVWAIKKAEIDLMKRSLWYYALLVPTYSIWRYGSILTC